MIVQLGAPPSHELDRTLAQARRIRELEIGLRDRCDACHRERGWDIEVFAVTQAGDALCVEHVLDQLDRIELDHELEACGMSASAAS